MGATGNGVAVRSRTCADQFAFSRFRRGRTVWRRSVSDFRPIAAGTHVAVGRGPFPRLSGFLGCQTRHSTISLPLAGPTAEDMQRNGYLHEFCSTIGSSIPGDGGWRVSTNLPERVFFGKFRCTFEFSSLQTASGKIVCENQQLGVRIV